MRKSNLKFAVHTAFWSPSLTSKKIVLKCFSFLNKYNYILFTRVFAIISIQDIISAFFYSCSCYDYVKMTAQLQPFWFFLVYSTADVSVI